MSRRSFLWNCWGIRAFNFVANSAWTGEQLELSQTLSQNVMARMVNFVRKKWFWSEARRAGRRPWQRIKKAKNETVCPAEPQAPAEAQVLRWWLSVSFCSRRTCKNSMSVYLSDFPEMTASTQNVICWTAHTVRWNKVTPNQNNNWCHDELW